MVVGEIWRYPVKSMGGEQLTETMLTFDGIPGDRVVHARDDDDVLTARNHPALLGFHATLGVDGEPLVDDVSTARSQPALLGCHAPVGGEGARRVGGGGGVESEQRRMVARGQHVV